MVDKAEIVKIRKSTISHVSTSLKKLENKGLVEKIQSKDNKKHIEIVLLDKAELIVCVKSILDNFIHQTVGTKNVDPECGLNYAVGAPVEKEVNCVISNSLGFGGHNVSLLVKRFEE